MGVVIRPGLTYVVYLCIRQGMPAMGVMLENEGVLLGVEVGLADSGLFHCTMHYTWGLVGYIIGGRLGLVVVSHYSFPASCMAMLSVDQSAIYHRDEEGAGKSNLKNKAVRISGGGQQGWDLNPVVGTLCVVYILSLWSLWRLWVI